MVRAKLWNCRVRCRRIASSSGSQIARTSADRITVQIERLPQSDTLASVWTVEGNGARAYFAAIRSHLNPAWEFPARRRRPPPDPFNAVLSASYTLLTESVYSATVLAGLDPYCGYFHSERPGRPALVLDLMEEFRPLIADTVALNLVNRRMLTTHSFRHGPPERPVILSRDGYRTLLTEYGRRLRDRVTIPGVRRRTTFQRLLGFQARKLAAFIGGREVEYKAFRTR